MKNKKSPEAFLPDYLVEEIKSIIDLQSNKKDFGTSLEKIAAYIGGVLILEG